MAKGYKCPTCEAQSGQYDNGHYQCSDEECGSIWWGPFDRPHAGEKRKGYKCSHCGRQTVHPVGELKDVRAWRCSTCASTILEAV